eukprot:tig00000629_g2673.t1
MRNTIVSRCVTHCIDLRNRLAKPLEHFQIDVSGAVGLDVGGSTGGFTDVLLASGARRVYSARTSASSSSKRRTQGAPPPPPPPRSLSPALPNPALELQLVDVVVCDASFIGLATVLPAAMALGADGCRLVALITPQFEVGKGNVGKGGIVRDPALHRAVWDRILAWLDDPDGRHAAQRAGLSGRSPHVHGPCPRASPRVAAPAPAPAPSPRPVVREARRAAPRLGGRGGGSPAGQRRRGRLRVSSHGAAAWWAAAWWAAARLAGREGGEAAGAAARQAVREARSSAARLAAC